MGRFFSLVVVLLCGGIPGSTARLGRNSNRKNAVPGEYIVVYQETFSAQEIDDLFESAVARAQQEEKPSILLRFSRGIRGVAVEGLSEEAIQFLEEDEAVAWVEKNRRFRATVIDQTNPPWGLDRINQSGHDLDQTYSYQRTGNGVKVFVVDSGVRLSHEDFSGRATCGLNVVFGEDCDDYFGHGTHVAAIIGGETFGVAKDVEIVSVKTLNRQGEASTTEVLQALEYVQQQKQDNPNTPMLANMSLAGGKSRAINAGITSLVNAGVPVVVSAGNSYLPACRYTPASAEGVISVGSTTKTDCKSSFSNWGACIDLWAPGSNIRSAWVSSDTASEALSGTSMAAPHVAGAVALYLEVNPSWGPAEVREAMLNDAIPAVRFPFPRSPKLLLNTEKIP